MMSVLRSKTQETFYPLKFQRQLHVLSIATSRKSAFSETVYVHFSHNSHDTLYMSCW